MKQNMEKTRTMIQSNNYTGEFKRVLEICHGIPEERKAFFENPHKWLESRKFNLDPEETFKGIYACICREKLQGENVYLNELSEAIKYIHDLQKERTAPERFENIRFRKWFERKRAKNRIQSRLMRGMEGDYFMPVIFELADGCSMGCPFCCLDAKPLKKIFRYTPENAELWKDILKITVDVIGKIADTSACYFATEPFDNPDYEKFLENYRDIMGDYPQTTTAAAQKNIGRTKAFLRKLSDENLRKAAVRFSVTNLEQLKEIHDAFSADELKYVELLLNNPESENIYSRSGRARELSKHLPEQKFSEGYSCVCTCGFAVNMVHQTITLMSPHRPDEEYPEGIEIYEKRSFQDQESFKSVLEEMIQKWMYADFPDNLPMHLCKYVETSYENNILTVHGDGIRKKIGMNVVEYQCFREMMEEKKTLLQAAEKQGLTGYMRDRFRSKMKSLYDAGYIEEIITLKNI